MAAHWSGLRDREGGREGGGGEKGKRSKGQTTDQPFEGSK